MAKSLAALLRSKIGRMCWFRHTDGHVIEGIYKRGRKVEQLTKFSRSAGGFDSEVAVWTVPRSIKITFGAPPAEGGR